MSAELTLNDRWEHDTNWDCISHFQMNTAVDLLIHSKTSDLKGYLWSGCSPWSILVASCHLLAGWQLVLTFDGAITWESTLCYRRGEAVWIRRWWGLKILLAYSLWGCHTGSQALSLTSARKSTPEGTLIAKKKKALMVSGKKRVIPSTRRNCFYFGMHFQTS